MHLLSNTPLLKKAVRRLLPLSLCVLFTLSVATPAQFPEPENVVSTAFSPDGKTLAVAANVGVQRKQNGTVEIRDTETGEERLVITGFDGPVMSVVFSDRGKTLVTSSSEIRAAKLHGKSRNDERFTELKWWDAETGELKHKKTFSDKDYRTVMLSSSPSGDTLACVEYYGESSVSLSPPEGGFIGSQRGSWSHVADVNLLDAQTGELRLKVKNGLRSSWTGPEDLGGTRILRYYRPTQFLRQGAVFSPDGRLLATNTPANQVKVWDARTGKEVYTLKDFKGLIGALAFSPDSRALAVGTRSGRTRKSEGKDSFFYESEIRLVDAASGKVTDTLDGGEGELFGMAFMPDSRVLLTSSYQTNDRFNLLQVLDVQTKKTAAFRIHEESFIRSLLLSPDGRFLALKNPFKVTLLDTQTWGVKYSVDKKADRNEGRINKSRFVLSVSHILTTAFSPDGKTLAGGNESDEIKLWDPRTGELKRTLSGHEGAVTSLSISADGNTLVSGSLDETVRVWDLRTGGQKALITPRAGEISSAVVSPDARTLAIGTAAGAVTLWDADGSGGGSKREFGGHQAVVNGVAFSEDGRRLASAGGDGTIKIWDVQTGGLQKTLTAGGKVLAVSFAPGGQTLASAGDDGTVSLWDVGAGAVKQTLKKHEAPVNALAFSRDGELLASGSEDKSVVIWETSTGKSKKRLKDHDLTVTSVAFSPDGSRVASGSGNNSVVLWDVRNGKLDRILK